MFSAAFVAPEVDPTADATAVAAQVATRCGNPSTLAEVSFVYIKEVDGVEVARRHHRWQPRDGSVQVSWDDHVIELESLHPYVASTAPPDLSIDAYSAFINDSYWLLAPCQVLDDKTVLAVTQEGQLALSFAPDTLFFGGDRYWMTLDDGVVTQWDVLLKDGGHQSYTWDAPTRYGPLELSPRRVSADGRVVIRFEEIKVQ